jgi:hypothetical protein
MDNKKEKTKEYNKEYYSKNKNKIAEQLSKVCVCENCGRTSTHQHLPRHYKTELCKRGTVKKLQTNDL